MRAVGIDWAINRGPALNREITVIGSIQRMMNLNELEPEY